MYIIATTKREGEQLFPQPTMAEVQFWNKVGDQQLVPPHVIARGTPGEATPTTEATGRAPVRVLVKDYMTEEVPSDPASGSDE